jgi:cephalosporin-C deacetylase-like acetyl esterase
MIRRSFLKTAAALTAHFPSASGAGAPSYRSEMPDMLLQHLARRLNALSAKWDQERVHVRTPAKIEERNRYVREKFIEMLGGLPQRTPLNPVVVKTFERDRYRVENVMYESRPGFWVTANLYVPTTGRGQFPGILSPCGHEWDGRMYRLFQLTYQDLVRTGFVVLGFDPVGMGERREYAEAPNGRSELGGPMTWEHSLPGQLMLLLGENLTQYRVWDAMRSLDYLASRPEVDKDRIGCSGQSSGGLFTMFLSAIDERIRCAAVHEGGTQRKWPVEIRPETVVDPPDIEQNLFPAALWGVDLPDLHAAIAPRPLLATHERFSPDFLKAASEVRARYELLGVPEKFAIASADDPHAMTMKLRLATVDWFSRWFLGRKGPERELDLTLELRERLYCTSTGLVRTSHQGDTLLLRIAKKQARLPQPGAAPASEAEIAAFRDNAVARICQLVHFQKSDGHLGVREIVTTPRRGYRVEKIEFLSEPGIYIPAWVFVPDAVKDRVPVLYVSDRGVDSDGLEFGPIEALLKQGRVVTAVDVRGIGETKPPHLDISGRNEFRHVDSVETQMTYMSWEMNESLFGMRVQDVVRSVDYVLNRPDVDSANVRAVGSGRGALWVLFAAALDARILAAVCEQGLLSYRMLTATDRYTHGADIFIPSILEHLDLPQVAAAIVPRRLSVVAPVDAMKRPIDAAAAERAYDWTRKVYTNAGAREQFRIVTAEQPLAASAYFALL